MTFSFEKERLTARSQEGTLMGQITFPRVRAGLVNIDRVMASPSFRGQGVETAMLEALLAHLTKLGLRAALTDPIAQQYLQDHPEWSHILPGSIHFTSH